MSSITIILLVIALSTPIALLVRLRYFSKHLPPTDDDLPLGDYDDVDNQDEDDWPRKE